MMPHRLLAIILCFLPVLTLKAQDSLLYKRITIHETQISLESAIDLIEKRTGLSFSYNSGLIDKKSETVLNAENEPLLDVLKRILNDPGLNFSIIGRHLVIYKAYKARALNPESVADSVFYFMVSGRIMDRDTRQPLAFSSVYLVGRTIGTISNEEGEFQLKLSSEDLRETLRISSIGYKDISAPVTELINTTRHYFLETDIIPIQEVIIRRINPDFLLQSALKNIRANYPSKPSILTSFYRETIQRGNRYTMVSEAVLENYKSGYDNAAVDRIRILKGRKNEDLSGSDSVMLKLKAGLSSMLLLDVVKNIPDFLSGENMEDYHYRLADIVVDEGRDHYVVEFTPKENSPAQSFYSGRIVIDIKDMAYKWVEFQVDQPYLDLANETFVVKKPPRMIVKTLKAGYKVAFRKYGNKYYLNMIQAETSFKIRYKQQLSGSVYNTRLEMAVIDVDTTDVDRFAPRESARTYEFFTDQLGDYDESFWGEYNFIKPDESLENALVKLRKAQTAKKE